MEKYFSDPFWLLGAIGWVVGIISGYLQVKSYQDQRKFQHGHQAILEQAERDWEGKFTQEQINSMKQELRRLEESINLDIPRKARLVFLEDQLATLRDELARNYSRYNELVAEVGNVDKSLPDQIQRTIETSIMPSYIVAKRESRQVYWLLVIAVFLIVILNWDFFAGLIPLDWKVGDYFSGFYPLSWLVIYFSFSIILALFIHQTFIGTWIKKFVSSARKENDQESIYKSFRDKVKAELQFGFKISIFIVVMMLSIFSPVIFTSITKNNFGINYEEGYATKFVSMPLSSVPLTILCAIAPAIVLFLLYDFVTTVKRRTSKHSVADKSRSSSRS